MNLPREIKPLQEFVIAAHGSSPGDLDKVKQLLAEYPEFLNQGYEWDPTDIETALQAAAHMGQPAIAEYLLSQGAPLDICSAAMLGRSDAVQQFLAQDPTQIYAVGAHTIPLLTHAVWSDNISLVQQIWEQGAYAGASEALSNIVSEKRFRMASWLLEHCDPDLNWKNFQGKTVIEVARDLGETQMIRLLEEYDSKR
ncbi:MAG: ankyrin repeat domain-containing protein [Anaerolineales bacterium]|nr:ankyrin repeat domain-containing protein [Anaerolineales bacterium]